MDCKAETFLKHALKMQLHSNYMRSLYFGRLVGSASFRSGTGNPSRENSLVIVSLEVPAGTDQKLSVDTFKIHVPALSNFLKIKLAENPLIRSFVLKVNCVK